MREITSPVKKFPGTVVLPDALTWTQYLAWNDAIRDAASLDVQRKAYTVLGGILACVTEWKLEGIPDKPTLETFPATPPTSVVKVINWLMREIDAMLSEADEAPN